jgi:putative transcriptional regulator
MDKEPINRIKGALADANKSQQWLAEQLGFTERTISKYCTNSRQPSLYILKQIADVMDVDISELLIRTKNWK